jgi:signal transduction histidine kinase
LLLLVIIPILAAVALGGIRVASSVQSAFAYQRVVQLANLNGKIIGLVQALQRERQDTITFITLGDNGGRAAAQSPNSPFARNAQLELTVLAHGDYAASARSASQVKSLLADIGTGYPELTQQDARAAIAAIDGLGSLRAAATRSQLPPLVVIQGYDDKINTLLTLDDQVAVGSSDSALAGEVRVAGLVSAMKEEAAEEQALITAAQSSSLIGLSRAGFTPDIQSAITASAAQQQANEAQFDGAATASQRQLFDSALSAPTVAGAQAQVQQAISLTPSASPGTEDPVVADAESSLNDVASGMHSVEERLVNAVIARSTALRNNAITDVIIWGVAILLVLLLAFLATVAVGRSMIRPLRRLRAGALDVAGVRLPEAVRRINETDGEGVPQEVVPIDVDSIDEIGEVARAFDQVHREAIRLASNEAALRGNVNAMFVNLSRRSQSLVERQIRLIDDLEQGEQDAERLANLFQMDHLATRMRRNSENLLVLAGHDVARRWTQEVGLVDVLRAAVSEIEQYERVTLSVQPGISVRGQAVNDVVHLLSELAENATSFSAAGTPVNVSGHLLNSGGVLLDITDQGVGMDAEEMAHANWRLDNPPVVDVAVSRRMGLFVVARLAARHGIRVRLRAASRGGLTALVWLPDEVITHETITTPPGLRRFEVTAPGAAVPASPDQLSEWPEPGQPEDRSAAMQAVNAIRAPRFAPLRPDLSDTAAFSAADADAGTLPVADAAASYDTGNVPRSTAGETPVSADAASEPNVEPSQALSFGAPVGGDDPQSLNPSLGGLGTPTFGAEVSQAIQPGVVVPPPASPGEENRLPIFESVESDWFRRGRHGTDHPARAGTGAAGATISGGDWTSPADVGWEAAEVAHAPVSGGTTVAGLPKRVPQANLVPGGVGAGTSPTSPAPARSAAQTRERLASFQRGIREGRAAAQDDEALGGDDDNALYDVLYNVLCAA